MELLENDQKRLLLKKTAKHRQDMADDARIVSERTEKIMTNTLIISGALLATYLIVRQFSKSEPKDKSKKVKLIHVPVNAQQHEQSEPSSPGIASQIGSVLTHQATTFLLNYAKDKLMQFLQSQKAQTRAVENENS